MCVCTTTPNNREVEGEKEDWEDKSWGMAGGREEEEEGEKEEDEE